MEKKAGDNKSQNHGRLLFSLIKMWRGSMMRWRKKGLPLLLFTKVFSLISDKINNVSMFVFSNVKLLPFPFASSIKSSLSYSFSSPLYQTIFLNIRHENFVSKTTPCSFEFAFNLQLFLSGLPSFFPIRTSRHNKWGTQVLAGLAIVIEKKLKSWKEVFNSTQSEWFD